MIIVSVDLDDIPAVVAAAHLSVYGQALDSELVAHLDIGQGKAFTVALPQNQRVIAACLRRFRVNAVFRKIPAGRERAVHLVKAFRIQVAHHVQILQL